jgi:hypothetical protein
MYGFGHGRSAIDTDNTWTESGESALTDIIFFGNPTCSARELASRSSSWAITLTSDKAYLELTVVNVFGGDVRHGSYDKRN